MINQTLTHNYTLTALCFMNEFFLAIISIIYTDRFGRKNAILVWTIVTFFAYIVHSFMTDKYGFLVLRAIEMGSNVS